MAQPQPQDRVGMGILISAVLNILLGWLPIIGPLVAGYFGGKYVSTGGKGFVVGFLGGIFPAILFGVVLLPFLGPLALVGAAICSLLFLVGAVISGIGGVIGAGK